MNTLDNREETMLDFFRLIGVNESLGSVNDPIDILNKIGKRAVCCRIMSSSLKDSSQKLYLFASIGQFLFVMLDNVCPKEDELADEEIYDGEEPLYFSESSHRVSPVYTMKNAAKKFLEIFGKRSTEVDNDNIFYYLLTSSHIMNKIDMRSYEEGWAGQQLLVEDDYTFCKGKEIVANDQDLGRGAPFFFRWVLDAKKKLEEDEEFDMLLTEFLESSRMELEKGKENSETSEKEEEDDDVEYEYDEDEDDQEEEFEPSDNNEDEEDNGLMLFEAKLKASKIYEPQKGEWQDYIEDDDPDFYDTSATDANGKYKRLPIAPHQILECIMNAKTLLNNMVGISDMKNYITKLIDFAKYNELLKSFNVVGHNITLHSVFTGNPGTGKTTLASILGSLLKDAGILSKGHVVMCNRASFCSGRCWGDEEKAVAQLVKIAKGGVLFIDEAYNLISPNQNDPGYQVLPNLLTYLSDEDNRDICVVLAGYPKEMQKLLETNPGIDSRFPNRFEFKDYTLDELMKITLCRIEKHGYTFTPAARHAFESHLKNLFEARDSKTWGNARTVANLLEKTYMQHAMRVLNTREPNILKLKVRDIPQYQRSTNNSMAKRIGFGVSR